MINKIKNIATNIQGDKVIWALVLVFALMSIVAVYSSSGSLAYRLQNGNTEYYLIKQSIFLTLGLLLIYVSHHINYTFYKNLAKAFFVISIPLLIYTLVGGSSFNDGSRWISFMGITFQTSDIAKIGLFMFLSLQLSQMQNDIGNLRKVFIRIFAPVLLICALIAVANLSTALMIGCSSGVLFFIGRVKPMHLLVLFVTCFFAFAGVYTVSKITGKGRAATWEKRIKDFMSKDDNDIPDQVMESKFAIAKGGFFGKGPGNSTQRNFLPESNSDFIYSIILEEYGIFGGAVVMFLYLLLLWRSILIVKKCPFAFGAFLAVGLSFTLVFQALLNMGVNVNLLPVTGLTLPLISSGGTSVLFTCLSIGIILSVSKFVELNEAENKEKEIIA